MSRCGHSLAKHIVVSVSLRKAYQLTERDLLLRPFDLQSVRLLRTWIMEIFINCGRKYLTKSETTEEIQSLHNLTEHRLSPIISQRTANSVWTKFGLLIKNSFRLLIPTISTSICLCAFIFAAKMTHFLRKNNYYDKTTLCTYLRIM